MDRITRQSQILLLNIQVIIFLKWVLRNLSWLLLDLLIFLIFVTLCNPWPDFSNLWVGCYCLASSFNSKFGVLLITSIICILVIYPCNLHTRNSEFFLPCKSGNSIISGFKLSFSEIIFFCLPWLMHNPKLKLLEHKFHLYFQILNFGSSCKTDRNKFWVAFAIVPEITYFSIVSTQCSSGGA